MASVGLGYITLGQPAAALADDEAQRIKLSCELARRATGSPEQVAQTPGSFTGSYLAGVLGGRRGAGHTPAA